MLYNCYMAVKLASVWDTALGTGPGHCDSGCDQSRSEEDGYDFSKEKLFFDKGDRVYALVGTEKEGFGFYSPEDFDRLFKRTCELVMMIFQILIVSRSVW